MSEVIFYGEYEHSLDEKGRVILPAKFRELLGDKCHITRGYDKCLTVYSEEGWEKFLVKMAESIEHEADKNHRKVMRGFASGGVDLNIDKQGRMLIPPILRNFAEIEKEVSIIGSLNKIEIWDKEKWNAYISDPENTMEEAAEKVEQSRRDD